MSLSYAFSSEPRAATEGRYREEDEDRFQNLMHDHRVHRGSTYAMQRKVARAQDEEQKRSQFVRRKKPRKVRNIYAYKAPKPERREVDLSAHLEEQTPLPVSAGVGTQTVAEEGKYTATD